MKKQLKAVEAGKTFLNHKYVINVYDEKSGKAIDTIERVVSSENYFENKTYCRFAKKEHQIFKNNETGRFLIFVDGGF